MSKQGLSITPTKQFASQLPSAIELFEQDIFKHKKPVLFLDFDGTLAPIVSNPDSARLDDQMQKTLAALIENTACAIITGRDRADIEKRIAIEKLIYAGSHGYDITGPDLVWVYEEGKACIPALDEAQDELNQILSDAQGVKIERKRFAIAVHYRHVSEEQTEDVLHKIHSVINKHSCLKAGPGNKVLELKPNIEWNKGKALTWIMNHLNLTLENSIPIFIGDDLTDEDAFETIAGSGIGIIVGDQAHPTLATYKLKDPKQVGSFLDKLIKVL